MRLNSDALTDAVALVEREARLLDERRFEEWLALYAEDAWYWMPANHGQQSPEDALSILYEDRRLLALRIRRLANPNIHIETPASRTHHHLTSIVPRALGGGAIEVESMQLVVLFREGQQRLFSMSCRHRLVNGSGSLLIREKTVRLIDCDQAHLGFAVPF